MYTVDAVVVRVWLAILLRILQAVTQSQHNFTTVTGSPVITGSFRMVTNREPGLCSKYGDVPLPLQCLQVFFSKLWETDRCHQAQRHKGHLKFSLYTFKWHGIIAQSTALLACTRVHYIYTCITCSLTHTHTHTHTLHTCCCCNWYFLSYLMCEFPPPSSAGERPVAAEGSPPRVLWGKLLCW